MIKTIDGDNGTDFNVNVKQRHDDDGRTTDYNT